MRPFLHLGSSHLTSAGEAMSTKPRRSIRLVRHPKIDGVGVCCLTMERERAFYTFVEIPCEIGGRGFAVHKLGMGTLYHVRIGAVEDASCECLGFLRHGTCRHVLGLQALVQGEKL